MTDAKQLSFFDLPGFNDKKQVDVREGDGCVQLEMFTPEELKKLRTKKQSDVLKVKNETGNLDK